VFLLVLVSLSQCIPSTSVDDSAIQPMESDRFFGFVRVLQRIHCRNVCVSIY
jgi:hypothetical protein